MSSSRPERALCALEQLMAPRPEPIEKMNSGDYLLRLAEKHLVAVSEREGPPDHAKHCKHYLYGAS